MKPLASPFYRGPMTAFLAVLSLTLSSLATAHDEAALEQHVQEHSQQHTKESRHDVRDHTEKNLIHTEHANVASSSHKHSHKPLVIYGSVGHGIGRSRYDPFSYYNRGFYSYNHRKHRRQRNRGYRNKHRKHQRRRR